MLSINKTAPTSLKRLLNGRGLLFVGILVCAIAVSIYCVWILDRGFEITDESYYILLAKNSDPSIYYISAQHWVTSLIWRVTGGIYSFRASGLIILIFSSSLLAIGSYLACVKMNIITHDRASMYVVVASAIVGSLFYATTINLSPNYNLLASAAAYSATGLFLIGCNCSRGAIDRIAIYALVGCAIGLEILCKASSGVSTSAILIVWLAIYERSFLRSITIAITIVLSAACLVTLLLVANTTFDAAQQSLTEGLALFRIVQSEAVSVRLLRYALQFWQYLSASLLAFALPVAACTVYAATGRTIFLKMAIIALVAVLFWGGHFTGGWSNGSALFPPYAIFSIFLMILIAAFSVWCRDLNAAALFCGLISLPYSVAMGTGNALFTQVVVTLSPWATVAALLAIASYPREVDRNAMAAMTLVFIATLSLQIFTSGDRPYHMAKPLRNQSKSVTLPNLGNIKVDEDTAKFLQEVNLAVEKCDVAPGTVFWGLYNVPGLALAMDTFPLVTPWLNNAEQANFVIDRRPDVLNQPSVVVLNDEGRGEMPPIPEKLMNSPAGIRLCGATTFPFANQRIEIWKRG